MCGIFGFVGCTPHPADEVVEGLRRLEYRGYDSWGIAAANEHEPLKVLKSVGKISRTTPADLAGICEPALAAIGHTRWATHGEPSLRNAHPHLSASGRIAVVHNGIIENHRELRTLLEAEGYVFQSETDTEVIAHLIDRELQRTSDIREALSRAILEMRGAFGLAILDAETPDRIFAVRLGSPLVVGIGEDRRYVASDANALVAHADHVIYLDDGEWAEISGDDVATYDFQRAATSKKAEHIELELAATDLGDFPHYMLKEIFDQPNAISDSLRGRLLPREATVRFAGLSGLAEPNRIKMIACGTSWHAAQMGKYYFEELAGVPAEVEYASEFRYRNAVIEPGTLVIAISQSGETADTLAGLRESMRRGAQALGIVNVVGSSIARECGRGIYTHAGPEFGVAATKSFTNQAIVLLMLAIYFGRRRGMSIRQGLELLGALERLPSQTQTLLQQNEAIRNIAMEYVDASNFLYIGRSLEFPIALEGALKLKEVSYIHAEGLPAAELKHGPIALITQEMPTVVIATQSFILDKVASNVQEIRARGGRIISIVSEENDDFEELSDHIIRVPHTDDMVSPILASIPAQLLAYHLAVLRGCDVDQPRNLAKSVTVE